MPFIQTFVVFRRRPPGGHVQQIDEEVVAQGARAIGEYAVVGAVHVGVQAAHAAHQHGHFRHAQRQQVGLVHQAVGGGKPALFTEVVPEAVRLGLHHRERLHIGHGLSGVGTPRGERHLDVVAGVGGGFLDGRGPAQHDHVRQGDFAAAEQPPFVEVGADLFQRRQHLIQLFRVVHRPVLLRRQRDPAAVGAAAQVGTPEGGGGGPGGAHQLRHGEPGREDFLFKVFRVALGDQLVIHFRNRVLPDQGFVGHVRAQVAGARAHVPVGQLEPGAREGVLELFRVFMEALGDLAVLRIDLQRQVGGEHDRGVALAFDVRVRHQVGGLTVGGDPLNVAGRALGLHPLIAKQVVQVLVRPGGGVHRPGAFQAAGVGVGALAGAAVVLPAQALLLDGRGGGLRFQALLRLVRAVGFAEGMTAGDQRHHLFIAHGHAGKTLTDRLRRQHWIRLAVGALRVHIDQAHLHGGQRLLQLAVLVVALIAQPLGLRTPVGDVRFPIVLAAPGEAVGLEAHVFHGHGAGQHHQVGPGNTVAVLLLKRPQQTAGLIQADVVRPAVERLETLLGTAGAAAAIVHAVGAGAVPGHADKERAVVAVIRGPPVLGIGHQRAQVRFQRVQIELGEGLGVIKIVRHRAGFFRVLTQRAQIQGFRPPVRAGHR